MKFWYGISDSCEVNNGGCDPNAACSHDAATNAVKCTCKTGYTNTGSGSTVVCTGKISNEYFLLSFTLFKNLISNHISDSCQVNNGGCDPCASCSHDPTTNAVQCTCKIGYTNTGSGSNVVCKGNITWNVRTYWVYIKKYISDSCTVNNGGCDPNAFCSHDAKTNAVECTCKTGYTNTGSGSTTVCKGNASYLELNAPSLTIEPCFIN